MANYYVDSVTGDNGDNGTTMALAWETLDYAIAQSYSAGDTIWVRRLHDETAGSTITILRSGTASSPVSHVGWPRDTHSITSATWTNNSTTVDLVVPASMDREKHCGRYITAPDGETYLITKITDSNTFIIDREYASSTVTLTNGASTIQADEDFSGRPADTASWDDDADDLPVLSFNGTAYYLNSAVKNYVAWKNIEFRGGTASAIVYISYSKPWLFMGCLFYQSEDKACILANLIHVAITRCVFEGSGAGSVQRALICQNAPSYHLKDCAIYNFGDNGIYLSLGSQAFLENVNIGVEVANGDEDLIIDDNSIIVGKDIKLGGNNGYIVRGTYNAWIQTPRLENYGKELGKHKSWFAGGTWESVTAGDGSPIPDQRSGGATSLIQITPDGSGFDYIEDWAIEVFNHEFIADTNQRTWRYYVQTNIVGGLTASELWIKLEYVKVRDDDSEYVIKSVVSDETISARSGITDWSDYIEVPSITPAATSKVRIRCYVAVYDAANKIWIDPDVVNP